MELMRCYKMFSTIITKEHAKTLQFIVSNELFLSKVILKQKELKRFNFYYRKFTMKVAFICFIRHLQSIVLLC